MNIPHYTFQSYFSTVKINQKVHNSFIIPNLATMLSNFSHYITDKGLFRPEEKVLLAVSGGKDSVAMAHLFYLAGFKFGIAHCNFTLRGKESEEDESFVHQLASRYGVPFYVKNFQTLRYASEKKISLQMAARELRYQWFKELLEAESFDYLATAHHKNDILETLLLNLTRGTGIRGLHGIKPKSGKIIRPLLFSTSENIMEFIQKEQLQWREDSSNESVKYQRNLLRHEVIPLLKKINPNLEETIEQSIEKLSAVERIFLAKIEEVKNKAVVQNAKLVYVSIHEVQQQSEPGILLYEILKPYNFNYPDTLNLLSSKVTGKRIESSTHVAVRDRDHFIVSEKTDGVSLEHTIENGQTTLVIDDYRLSFSIMESADFAIPANPQIACLNVDKLKFPLTVRQWKEGDSFFPLGMSQKKKISDFLIDSKVPLNLKDNVNVLISEGNIVWVIGFRIDERYRIGNDTEKIFRIMKENL